MTRLLCQMCGGPADRTADGVLWLIGEDHADQRSWPDPLLTLHPPVCAPCAVRAVRACPHLRGQHVLLRVRAFELAGVRGALYRPGWSAPVVIDVAGIGFDDPRIAWVKAGQLIARLREFTVTGLDAGEQTCPIVPANSASATSADAAWPHALKSVGLPMAHFESDDNAVPMLCPGCCKLEDIPDWPDEIAELKSIAGCHRCGFTFPVLPGGFRALTLHALHNHRCKGPDDGNWTAVGKEIIRRLDELQRDPDKAGALIEAAYSQPQDDDEDRDDE